MKMTIEGAIDCLLDKTLCKFCKYQSENCRQEAIDIAVKCMKSCGKKDNDYIAEYIKERYPRLLGMDFAMWKIPKLLSNAIKDMANAFKRINSEEEVEDEE